MVKRRKMEEAKESKTKRAIASRQAKQYLDKEKKTKEKIRVRGAREGIIDELDAIGKFEAHDPERCKKEVDELFDSHHPDLPEPEDVISLLSKHYKGNPLNPNKAFAKEMLIAIQDELGLSTESTQNRITFMPTGLEKTKLDGKGIDGVFIYKDPSFDQPIIVTIDVTRRDEQDKGRRSDQHFDTRKYKTDVYIVRVPDPDLNPEEFEEYVDDHAKTVAGFLSRRLRQRGLRIED